MNRYIQQNGGSLLGSGGGGVRDLSLKNGHDLVSEIRSRAPNSASLRGQIFGSGSDATSDNFGSFIEDQNSSSSLAAAKVAEELADTNETSIATTNQHGVKLVTRPTTSVANRLGYTGKHGLSNSSIRENPWDLNAMTARPTLVESFVWVPGTPAVTLYNLPTDLLVSRFMTVPFLSFKYFRGDIVIQFQVNASPLVQGCMMVSYIPMINKNQVWPTGSFDIRTWLSINQSMYIYANTNTVAEMRIPYFHWKSYLTIGQTFSPENNMGTLALYVLNPISSNGTVAGVNISMYMHLENAEFKVPLPNSSIPVDSISLMRGPRRPLRAQGNTTSNVTQVWDHVQGSSMTNKTEGDKVDVKASVDIPSEALAALDNPTFSIMLPNMTVKGAGHASTATGCEYVERLSIYPGALSVADEETFGTDIDEMVLANIKQRYSFVTSFNIAPADLPGTLKFSLPLAPIVGRYKMLNGTPYPLNSCVQAVSNPMYMPLLTYITLPFTTWTGGITYKFQFIASSVHTCKIFVGLHYGVYDMANLVDDLDYTGQYGVAYEINQGSNELEVTAPFIAQTPYLYVPRQYYDPLGIMGVMTFTIVNSLTSPDSVAPNIAVNVFVAGASDYQVNGIHPTLPFHSVQSSPSMLRAQSSVAPTNIAPTVTSIAQDDLVGPEQVHPDKKQVHMSRNISSIRDVLRKYQFVCKRTILPGHVNGEAAITSASSQKCYLRIDPWWLLGIYPSINEAESANLSGGKIADLGAFTWFTSMYSMFRGSLRFKFIVRPIMNTFGPTQPVVPYTPATWRVLYVPPTTHTLSTTAFGQETLHELAQDFSVVGEYIPRKLNQDGSILQRAPWTTGGAVPFTAYPVAGQSLLSITAYPSTVAEVETPYQSIFHSVPIKQFSNSQVNQPGYVLQDHGLGSIYVMLDFLTDMVYPNTGNAYPYLGADVEVYVAFGDETRLGNLNFIPLLYTNPLVTAGDTPAYLVSNWAMDFGTPAASEPLQKAIEKIKAEERVKE